MTVEVKESDYGTTGKSSMCMMQCPLEKQI
jgi:hypothetical protein